MKDVEEYVDARVLIFFVVQSFIIGGEGKKQSQNVPSFCHPGEKATDSGIFCLAIVFLLPPSLLNSSLFVQNGL